MRKRLYPSGPVTDRTSHFGAHSAVALALGFLFMGGGTRTFSTDNNAVAALVISLYPRFPLTPIDQRGHLQVRVASLCLSFPSGVANLLLLHFCMCALA